LKSRTSSGGTCAGIPKRSDVSVDELPGMSNFSYSYWPVSTSNIRNGERSIATKKFGSIRGSGAAAKPIVIDAKPPRASPSANLPSQHKVQSMCMQHVIVLKS
jgi:hypothetical protein